MRDTSGGLLIANKDEFIYKIINNNISDYRRILVIGLRKI